MGPDRPHWKLLRDLAHVTQKLLRLIFESPWWLGEVPGAWRKANNAAAIFRKVRKEEPEAHQPHSRGWESGSAGFHGRYFRVPKAIARMDFITNLIDGRECTLITFMMTPNWGDIGKRSSLCRQANTWRGFPEQCCLLPPHVWLFTRWKARSRLV